MRGYKVIFDPQSNRYEPQSVPVIFKEGMEEVYDTYRHACMRADTLNGIKDDTTPFFRGIAMIKEAL